MGDVISPLPISRNRQRMTSYAISRLIELRVRTSASIHKVLDDPNIPFHFPYLLLSICLERAVWFPLESFGYPSEIFCSNECHGNELLPPSNRWSRALLPHRSIHRGCRLHSGLQVRRTCIRVWVLIYYFFPLFQCGISNDIPPLSDSHKKFVLSDAFRLLWTLGTLFRVYHSPRCVDKSHCLFWSHCLWPHSIVGDDLPVPLAFIGGKMRLRPHPTAACDTLDCLQNPTFLWSNWVSLDTFQKITKKYVSEISCQYECPQGSG